MMQIATKLLQHSRTVGAWMWVLCGEYFIAQTWVVSHWKIPFDIRQNAISDLGAVTCGMFGNRQVCSPDHDVMNAGFVLLGLLMAGGAYLLWQHFESNRIGFFLIALSGLGAVIVGFFPEDTWEIGHISGAALSFIAAGIGIVWCGTRLLLPSWLRFTSIFLGALSLISLIALTSGLYQTLGFGTVERLVSYPTTIWLMTMGVYLLVTKK